MPELMFKGKEFVHNHHLAVPVRPLMPHPARSVGAGGLDGNLVIQGDNLEALKGLLPLYAGKVDCVFIDPPYNTGNEDWNYNDNVNSPMLQAWLSGNPVGIEDGLRHDKWLAMMLPRMKLMRELMAPHAVIIAAIDDNEVHGLRYLLEDVFGPDNFIAQLVWEKGKKGDARFFSINHEYLCVFARDKAEALQFGGRWRRRKEGVDEVLQQYKDIRTQFGDDHERIRSEMMAWYRQLPDGDPRKRHKHYNWSDDRGLYFADNFAGPDDGRKNRPRYDIIHPTKKRPCAKPSTGWRWEEERTLAAMTQTPPLIHFGPDETTIPCRKSYLINADAEPFPSVFYKDGRAATLQTEAILGKQAFNFPKDAEVLADLFVLASAPDATVLDAFAGSGTSGQSVMLANSRDGGNRRYILIESESYADNVTAERMRRVIGGYAFQGIQREELLRERLNWTKLCNLGPVLRHVETVEQSQARHFTSIEKRLEGNEIVVTGLRSVKQRTPGLGGTFTFCTLGPAPDLGALLAGEELPSFAALGARLFHAATHTAFNPVAAQSPVDGPDAEGLGYLGEATALHVWMLYRPDKAWLSSTAAALTLARARDVAGRRTPGKRHLVFAATRFVPQRVLDEARLPVEFAPLPFGRERPADPPVVSKPGPADPSLAAA